MIVLRITHPDQLRRFIRETNGLFADFLRRAKEPITVEHQWTAVLSGLAAGPTFLFLVAFDEKIKPVGYLLAQSGQDFYGLVYGNVIQVYAKPGHKVINSLEGKLDEWATQQNVQMFSGLTHRHNRGYARWMQRLGWHPTSVMYAKIRETPRGQTSTDTANSPEPVTA